MGLEKEQTHKIITREKAKQKKMVYYFTGKKCKHNHIAPRRVSNGTCIECSKEERKRYEKNNKEKCRERCKQYRLRNPEYFKEKDRRKLERESPEAKKNRIKRQRQYYEKNKEKLRGRNRKYRIEEKKNNPEAERIRSKRYRLKHPDRRADLTRYRRAIKNNVNADNVISLEVFKRDNWRCQMCNKKLKPQNKIPNPLAPTIDHIKPLSKGGSHTYQNIQLACYRCNCKKGNRTMEGGEQLRMF